MLFRQTLSLTLSFTMALAPLTSARASATAERSGEARAEQDEFARAYLDNELSVRRQETSPRLPLDTFSFLDQGEPWKERNPEVKKTLVVAWTNLLAIMRPADPTQAARMAPLDPKLEGARSNIRCREAKGCPIELWSSDRHGNPEFLLNEFYRPAEIMAVAGPFVAFATRDGNSGADHPATLAFVDLARYQSLVGNQRLPIFEIPLSNLSTVESLVADQDGLTVNGQKHLGFDELQIISDLYATVVNITANMVDPKAAAGSLSLYAGVDTYFERLSAKLNQRADSALDVDKLMETLRGAVNRSVDNHNRFGRWSYAAMQDHIRDQGVIDKHTLAAQTRYREGRQFLNRLRAFRGYITSPHANAGAVIVDAIRALGAKWLLGARNLPDILVELTSAKPAREATPIKPTLIFLSSVIGAFYLAHVMPDSYYEFISGGLGLGGHVAGYIGHVIYGLVDAMTAAATQVGRSLNPTTAYHTYIDPQHHTYLKTLVGVSVESGVLALGLGTWHISRRLRDLLKDMRKPEYRGLVDRQQRLEDDFVNDIVAGEKQRAHERDQDMVFDPAEEAAMLERLAQVKARHQREREQSWLSILSLKRWRQLISPRTAAVGDAVDQSMDTPEFTVDAEDHKIQTRGQAIRHLLLSAASYRSTVSEYLVGYNYISGFRFNAMGWFGVPVLGRWFERLTGQKMSMFIFPRPFAILSRFIYPNFYTVATTATEGATTMPSVLNGGMNTVWRSLWEWAGTTDVDRVQKAADREAEARVEDDIVAMENAVYAEVTKLALREFTQFSGDEKELQRLFSVSEGFGSVASPTIRTMKVRDKAFVRSYIDNLYQAAMHRLLDQTLTYAQERTSAGIEARAEREFGPMSPTLARIKSMAAQSASASGHPTQFVNDADLREIKRAMVRANQVSADPVSPQFSTEEVGAVVREIAQDPRFRTQAEQDANKLIGNVTTFKRYLRHEMLTSLDPQQNPAMGQIDIVRHAMKDPVAMARTTRFEISAIFRTLPLDAFMQLYLLAGMTEAMLKPVQEHFYSANSLGYFSWFAIYPFVSNVLLRSFQSPWYKVIKDAANNKKGEYGQLPEGDDIEKPRWKLFLKEWNKPDNSSWEIWKTFAKVALINLPADIVMVVICDLIFKGRIDIDSFLMGQFSYLFLMYNLKLTKADIMFEKTTGSIARGLKPTDLAYKQVQDWLQPKLQADRSRFNFWKHFLVAPIHETYYTTLYTGTKQLAEPFALWRYVTGGFTPTEAIVLKMRAASAAAGPGTFGKVVKHAAKFCEVLLTKNNVGLTRLIK